jgi:FKBP-type peptidyl-prolyl cis-trans isomerase SlyD
MNRSVVTFHYTLRDAQSRLLDTSEGGEPISYLEGAGHIIEGLEEQLRGTPAGTKRKIQVPAARAYGLRDESQVQCVPREVLPVDGELRPGDRFQAGEDRFAPIVMVTKIEGDQVWLDANHPLAGIDLVFDVEVVEVRTATSEEISHGHVHGRDGQASCGQPS